MVLHKSRYQHRDSRGLASTDLKTRLDRVDGYAEWIDGERTINVISEEMTTECTNEMPIFLGSNQLTEV
jgi:hypothetical protein